MDSRIISMFYLVVEACIRVHSKVSEPEMEEQIQEVLKHAPSKPGGSRFKVLLLAFGFQQ